MSQHGFDGERARARAAELRERGLSFQRVAATLTAEGYKTKRGGPWHAAVVWRLFRDDAPTLSAAAEDAS